jgi:1,5-anhydro-D-fructose reductase (1,5-anhydro-D-mannitol-forming)
VARSRESAARFARAHGIDRTYESFDAMLLDDALDAVYIATPNGLHPAQTLAALDAGKHVLVEKPVALTEADARAMAERADRAGLVLGAGFHLRHHHPIRELKERLDAGAIGEPTLIRASWGMNTSGALVPWKNDRKIAGGGAIMGLGVHVLDLCCWLLGDEPRTVTALSDATDRELDQLHLIGLSFDRGCLADIQVTRRFELHPNGITVHGPEGSLTALNALTIDAVGSLVGPGGETLLSTTQSPYVPELEAFAAAVRGEASFHADGWDGVLSVRLTEAVLRAGAR